MNALFAVDRYADLVWIQRGFLIMSVLVLLFLPADYFLTSRTDPAEEFENPAAGNGLFGGESLIEPYAAYQSIFQNSPFFGSYAASEKTKVKTKPLAELIKDYRLKGVIFLNVPEAIVADARTDKNIFVKAGDSLGEATVKEVRENEIILEYFGETHAIQMA